MRDHHSLVVCWGCCLLLLVAFLGGRCDAEDEDERTRVGSENREQGARESRPLRLSQRFALWSVTRGAGITGAWAVMSGWTVITARLNIGWSVSVKSSSPHVKLSANLPPAGFETLVGNTEQTYPAVPIQTWGTFLCRQLCNAMQCHQ